MALERKITVIPLDRLTSVAAAKKDGGWRYVQTLAVNTENGIDLIYTFYKDEVLEDVKVEGVRKGTAVPSVTDKFLAAFVFENEVHDLFGVDITDIAIDFKGNFYALSAREPMTIISPEQKAAREKAAKLAAAKAAKAKGGAAGAASKPASDDDAAFEAKLAAMDPEKAAKVRAAREAKKKAAEDAKKAEQDAKIADLDPEKAAKVKAALAAKAAREAKKAAAEKGEGNE